MVRALYSFLTWLVQPLLRRKLARRAVAEPGYAVAVEERFGHYSVPADQGRVWIHAVSLGETRAAAILLARLREQMPGLRLLLTNGTATGRAEGEKLLRPGDVQVWQPWDTPGAVARFLRPFQPEHRHPDGDRDLAQSHGRLRGARGAAGAGQRPTEREFATPRRQRLAWLARPAYARPDRGLGPDRGATRRACAAWRAPVQGVFGNLKFDAAPDAGTAGTRAAPGVPRSARPVILLASSREGEEALFLKEILAIASAERSESAINSEVPGRAGVQWLIVPRHPQRFDEVAALIAQAGFRVSRRSTWGDAPPVGLPDASADDLARRLAGRDGAVLQPGRCGVAGRQLRAAGWAEPDRGGGLRLPGRDGAAHLQFRARRPNSRRPQARRRRCRTWQLACRAGAGFGRRAGTAESNGRCSSRRLPQPIGARRNARHRRSGP